MKKEPQISRRDFFQGKLFRSLIGSVKKTFDETPPRPSQSKKTIPVLRPPGAIRESDFLQVCTRCDDCQKACPHDAIINAPTRYRQAVQTPIIDIDHSPCQMCVDTPCISACEVGALRKEFPVKIGTAKIQKWHCLAYQNSFCSVCVEKCPVPGAIDSIEGKPQIHEDQCTGCGICYHACPAPTKAIMVLPVLQKSHPEGKYAYD